MSLEEDKTPTGSRRNPWWQAPLKPNAGPGTVFSAEEWGDVTNHALKATSRERREIFENAIEDFKHFWPEVEQAIVAKEPLGDYVARARSKGYLIRLHYDLMDSTMNDLQLCSDAQNKINSLRQHHLVGPPLQQDGAAGGTSMTTGETTKEQEQDKDNNKEDTDVAERLRKLTLDAEEDAEEEENLLDFEDEDSGLVDAITKPNLDMRVINLFSDLKQLETNQNYEGATELSEVLSLYFRSDGDLLENEENDLAFLLNRFGAMRWGRLLQIYQKDIAKRSTGKSSNILGMLEHIAENWAKLTSPRDQTITPQTPQRQPSDLPYRPPQGDIPSQSHVLEESGEMLRGQAKVQFPIPSHMANRLPPIPAFMSPVTPSRFQTPSWTPQSYVQSSSMIRPAGGSFGPTGQGINASISDYMIRPGLSAPLPQAPPPPGVFGTSDLGFINPFGPPREGSKIPDNSHHTPPAHFGTAHQHSRPFSGHQDNIPASPPPLPQHRQNSPSPSRGSDHQDMFLTSLGNMFNEVTSAIRGGGGGGGGGNTKLPQLNLHKFTGRKTEFLSWWALFHDIYHINPSLRDSQKRTYLITLLSDEVREELYGTSTELMSYEDTLTIIFRAYCDPTTVSAEYRKQLQNLPMPKDKSDIRGIKKTVSLTKKYLNGLACLQQSHSDIGIGIADNFRCRLPADLQGEIIQITQRKIVSLSLVELINTLDHYWSLREDQITDNPRGGGGQEHHKGHSHRPHYQQDQQRTTTMATSTKKICIFCPGEGNHYSHRCQKVPDEDRIAFFDKNKLCYLCAQPTGPTHSAKNCKAQKCHFKTSWKPEKICNKNHHVALHYPFAAFYSTGATGGGPHSGGRRDNKQGPNPGNG